MSRPRRLRQPWTAALGLAIGATAAGLSWPPSATQAHSYKLEGIAVGHVWTPPPEKDASGVPVYGPVLNQSGVPVRLVAVTSPVAEEARFRVDSQGELRWPGTIEFQPDKPLALAPWREHIWLSGLKRQLAEGDSFNLTLDFGDSGTLTVKVVVEEASGH